MRDMRNKVFGTPDSVASSPQDVFTRDKLTPQSRGQALQGQVSNFFSGKRTTPSAAAGSANDLQSPYRKMVEEFSEGMPVTQDVETIGATSFENNDDNDMDISVENGTMPGDDDGEVVESSDIEETYASPSLPKKLQQQANNSLEKSPVIAVDDTPNVTPKPNKFLQQALLKAKKGSEGSPIAVDDTPAATPAKSPPSSVNKTPRRDVNSSSAVSPSRKPLENISNSPAHGVIQSPNREDDFDLDLPPVTPRSAKKNKRRSVCALPTPRRLDERPVSPSGRIKILCVFVGVRKQ